MCDPLSVIASAVAVIEVAAKSCEYLHKTLRRVSDAPKDIQHHITTVQALQSTFTNLSALEIDLENDLIVTPDFKARLQACTLDLQVLERLVKSFNAQLEESKVRRTWAKLRWSSVDQRHTLRSHLSRIESYHTTFSLDLLLLNM